MSGISAFVRGLIEEPLSLEHPAWSLPRRGRPRRSALWEFATRSGDTSSDSHGSDTSTESDSESETGDWARNKSGVIKRARLDEEYAQPILNNFFSKAQWSPDGSTLLTVNEDRCVRIFDPEDLTCPKRTIQFDMPVYVAEWFPLMRGGSDIDSASQFDPAVASATRFILAATQSAPAGFWHIDSGDCLGKLYATNPSDGDVPPTCLAGCFTPDGAAVACGYEDFIRIYDVRRAVEGCDLALASSFTPSMLMATTRGGMVDDTPSVEPDLSSLKGCVFTGIPPLPSYCYASEIVANVAYDHDETSFRGRPVLEIDVRDAQLYPARGVPIGKSRKHVRDAIATGKYGRASMYALRLPFCPQTEFQEREARIAGAVLKWMNRIETAIYEELVKVKEEMDSDAQIGTSGRSASHERVVGEVEQERDESGYDGDETSEEKAKAADDEYEEERLTPSDRYQELLEELETVRARCRWYFGDLNVSRTYPGYTWNVAENNYCEISTPRSLRHWPIVEEMMAIREGLAQLESQFMDDIPLSGEDSSMLCKGDMPLRQFATPLLEAILTPHSQASAPHLMALVDPFSKRRPQRKPKRRDPTADPLTLGMRGIVSTLDFCPYGSYWGGALAGGTYSGFIGVFDLRGGGRTGAILMPRLDSTLGVTQVMWSKPDGAFLFSGYRKAPHIDVWDLRSPGQPLLRLQREVTDSHHYRFAQTPDGRWLFTGSSENYLDIFDLHAVFKQNMADAEERAKLAEEAKRKAIEEASAPNSRPTVATAFALLQQRMNVEEQSDREETKLSAYAPTQRISIRSLVPDQDKVTESPALCVHFRPQVHGGVCYNSNESTTTSSTTDDQPIAQPSVEFAVAVGHRQLFMGQMQQPLGSKPRPTDALDVVSESDLEADSGSGANFSLASNAEQQDESEPAKSAVLLCRIAL